MTSWSGVVHEIRPIKNTSPAIFISVLFTTGNCICSGLKSLLMGLLLLGVCLFIATTVRAEGRLVLAVQPYLPASILLNRFQPLAKYLTEKLGREVIVDVSPSYQKHIQRIGSDKVDIAYLGPVPFVRIVSEYGEKPLL